MDDAILIDVTLRDGGYANDHSWSLTDAQRILAACSAASVKYCEVGYLRPAHHQSTTAPAASCPPGYLRALRDHAQGVALVVMAHADEVEPRWYRLLPELGVELLRLPTKIGELEAVAPHVEAAREAGLRVSVNLIRVSEVEPAEVARAARAAERLGASLFYVADSNGSMYPEELAARIERVRESTTLPLGFHAHNYLSLAFINALTALRGGVSHLDASLDGMGKGAGNLSLELIAAYLRLRSHMPYGVAALTRAATSVLSPWKGAEVAVRSESMVTGMLDLNLEGVEKAHVQAAGRDLASLLDEIPV